MVEDWGEYFALWNFFFFSNKDYFAQAKCDYVYQCDINCKLNSPKIQIFVDPDFPNLREDYIVD